MSDLEFGWHREFFVLSNVKIIDYLELQCLDEDGEWTQREPFLLGLHAETEEEKEDEFKAYEDVKELRYSNPIRRLTGNVSFPDSSQNDIFLGVPKGKKFSFKTVNESKIKSISITITEADHDQLYKMVKYGHINYYENSGPPYVDEGPYITLYAPSNIFDNIKNMADTPDIEFSIELNMKGWFWLGHMGEGYIFIDTENRQPVELAGLTVAKKFTPTQKELIDDDLEEVQVLDRDYSQNAINSNLHLLSKMNEIGKLINSVKLAVWISAFSVLAIAIMMWK